MCGPALHPVQLTLVAHRLLDHHVQLGLRVHRVLLEHLRRRRLVLALQRLGVDLCGKCGKGRGEAVCAHTWCTVWECTMCGPGVDLALRAQPRVRLHQPARGKGGGFVFVSRVRGNEGAEGGCTPRRRRHALLLQSKLVVPSDRLDPHLRTPKSTRWNRRPPTSAPLPPSSSSHPPSCPAPPSRRPSSLAAARPSRPAASSPPPASHTVRRMSSALRERARRVVVHSAWPPPRPVARPASRATRQRSRRRAPPRARAASPRPARAAPRPWPPPAGAPPSRRPAPVPHAVHVISSAPRGRCTAWGCTMCGVWPAPSGASCG